jgi:serine/threonine protein kinase
MDTAPPTTLSPGDALGPLRLVSRLGEGATAEVWKVSTERGEYRAAKVLSPRLRAHEAHRSRFLSEGRLLASIVHPRVLRVFEVVEDGERAWVTMAWMPGGTLQQRLDTDGAFDPRAALALVFDALEALEAAHRAGIIHRDVKPHNLLLAADDRAVLADFGSARHEVGGQLTRTGDTLGTLGYMAPEQRSDARNATSQTDIYAVGATLFGLVLGRPPLGLFEGQLDQDDLARLPVPIRELIRRATRYRPEWRFSTARDMAVEVARVHDILYHEPGIPAASEEWIARLDRGIDAAVLPSTPGSARLNPAGTPHPPRYNPAERTLPRLPAPPPATVWERMIAVFEPWFPGLRPPDPISLPALAGTWSGLLGGDPLRLDLDAARGGRVAGWVVVGEPSGEVSIRVEGHLDGRSLKLEEQSTRAGSGTYHVEFRAGRLVGLHRARDPGRPARNFSLSRPIVLPPGGR